MAQRRKKFTKKKKHGASREMEADSDGDFELVTEVRNDDSVRKVLDHVVNHVLSAFALVYLHIHGRCCAGV